MDSHETNRDRNDPVPPLEESATPADAETIVGKGDFEVGRKVSGRYAVRGFIGKGAFGAVYRVHDAMLQKAIALKALTGARGDGGMDALLEEARTIAKLDHPNIVPVYDAGIDDGTPWMTMRLIEGTSLGDMLAQGTGLEPDRARRLLIAVARALDHAHRKGIIHRDVKPSNILVEPRDGGEHAWLADFGIARVLTSETVTGANTVAGTPCYMAPEQITGKRIDARTDIFALGCVAVELLTGTRCFSGESYTQILYQIVHEQPRGLNELEDLGGAALHDAIRRALAKSAEDRFQTAEDFARAVGVAGMDAAAGATMPAGFGGFFARWSRPRPTMNWNGRFVLAVEGLRKSYGRGKEVLKGIDLKVETGSIYACLARNGVGKTTLIRTILAMYNKDAGSVSIFGRDPSVEGPAVLSRVGYVPETPATYETMNVGEFISFLRSFYQDWDDSFCYELLNRFELPLDDRIKNLSKGMQTKVSLIAALAHRPEFLIMDDPTLGLDAVVLQEVFDTLKEVSEAEGTSVLITSHNLEKIEKLATHIGFISDGRISLSDTLAGLKTRTREVKLTFPDDVPDFGHIDGFRTVRTSGRRLTGFVMDTGSDAMQKIDELGADEVEVRELSLEEIFVNFMR